LEGSGEKKVGVRVGCVKQGVEVGVFLWWCGGIYLPRGEVGAKLARKGAQ